jgi:hypothetical protein
MKKIIVVVLLLLLIASFSYRIDLKRSHHELIGELMYFPSGMALRALSMGFYAPLADLVWLRFIQYYGEHRHTDQRFDIMFHILDILTTLDQHFTYAYTLGGLMLTHDAERPDQARQLMRKGIDTNPDDWRMPFIYAFVHYVFLREYRTAHAYFRLSSQRPDAPDMAQRWAAFVLHYKMDDLQSALALWTDLYNTTENPEERAIAEKYIKDIVMKLTIELLQTKLEAFMSKTGRLPASLGELVAVGLIDAVPEEPHEGYYFIRGDSVYSSWQEK